MTKNKPKKLTVTVELTGRALDIVLSVKDKYDQDKRIISKSSIINDLIVKGNE